MCLTGIVRRTPAPRHAKEARDGASIQSEKRRIPVRPDGTSRPHPSSGPNREIRPLLRGRGRKGRTPLRSVSFVRYRNGAIPTIWDFDVMMVCVQAGPNRQDAPVSPRLGLEGGCFIASLVSRVIWKRPFSNDLRFWYRNGPRPARPQPGDAPVSRSWGQKGVRFIALRVSYAIQKRPFSSDS